MEINRNNILIFSLVSIIILGISAYYFYNKKFEAKYTWNTNYVYNNKQPYGSSVLYKLLNSYSNKKLELINNQSLNSFLSNKNNDKNSTYFVIGAHCNYDTEDVKVLKRFVKKGNTLFLALEELPENLLSEFNNQCSNVAYSYSPQKGKSINANFTNNKLKVSNDYRFFYKYLDKINEKYWEFFELDFCKDGIEIETLGIIDRDKANFIKIKYGKGQILIHSNPLFFTNLHLIRPEAADYAAKVFSYFPEGPIYWDRTSKLWSVKEKTIEEDYNETPFSYILKQKSLRWAFYMIWVLVILFVLFNLWRKQKAIPVKFPKNNSTLEFIHTIGELYFTQKDNKKLVIQKMNMFIKNMRAKYYITEKDEAKFIEVLSKKSEIKESNIQRVFEKYHQIKNSNNELHDDDLILFYQLLKKITKNSK